MQHSNSIEQREIRRCVIKFIVERGNFKQYKIDICIEVANIKLYELSHLIYYWSNSTYSQVKSNLLIRSEYRLILRVQSRFFLWAPLKLYTQISEISLLSLSAIFNLFNNFYSLAKKTIYP